MSAADPRTIAIAVRGPIDRADLQGLRDRVCDLLRRDAGAVVFCDVAGVPADAVTVDALATLRLAARKRGCQIRLRNASADLLDLVALMGLTDVLPE